MSVNKSSESIIQNLKDAGCNSETIEHFSLHREQKCIDCLDYLVYQIKKVKK